jgi:hypothetical protein
MQWMSGSSGSLAANLHGKRESELSAALQLAAKVLGE